MICFSLCNAEDWRDTEYVWDEEKGRMVEVPAKEKHPDSGLTEKERRRKEYKEERKRKKEAAKKRALELKRERKAKKDAEKEALEKHMKRQAYIRNYVASQGPYYQYLPYLFHSQNCQAHRRSTYGYKTRPANKGYQK